MTGDLHVLQGGSGEPALLLLHGLGATGDIWSAWTTLLETHWPGRWLAPDLPGHGRSTSLPRYSFGGIAARVGECFDAGEPVVVLGHSMGGVVGLALASGRFGPRVDVVVGLGIKVGWTETDLERAGALARRSVTWFESRDEAAARYLRVAGLTDLMTIEDPRTVAGVREADGRWRLAQDPATFGVGAPDMAGLVAAAPCPLVLARGENDPMVSHDQLTDLDPAAVTLPGLGHNAHVEDPETVAALLGPYTR